MPTRQPGLHRQLLHRRPVIGLTCSRSASSAASGPSEAASSCCTSSSTRNLQGWSAGQAAEGAAVEKCGRNPGEDVSTLCEWGASGGGPKVIGLVCDIYTMQTGG